MTEINDYKFRISISRDSYKSKAESSACVSSLNKAKEYGKSKMAFKEREVTVDEFLEYATNGYSFCNLFDFIENFKYRMKSSNWWNREYPVYQRGVNKGYFKLKFKSDDFASGSQVVFVDIDFTKFTSMHEYVSSLTYKPTCGYYSYSDRKDKRGIFSRRFRLVYVFDSIINKYEFSGMARNLYDIIADDTKEPISDYCGCSLSQYMNGGLNPDTYKSYIIYSKDDFLKKQPVDNIPIDIVNKLTSSSNVSITFNNQLVSDMGRYQFDYVVRKWWAKGLRYFTHTPIDFGNEYYVTTTDDYVQLDYFPEKIKDGHHRRTVLSFRAKLRRLIKEDVTPDELLFNLYIDREKFLDNSDGVITIKVLQDKAERALKTDLKQIRKLAARRSPPKFKINPLVKNKKEVEAAARTNITNNYIAEMFDTTATINENLVEINQSGYKVGKSRLYKWCQDNHITPVDKIVDGYNPELSIRKNMVAMNCTLYQVVKAKKAYVSSSVIVDNAHQLCLPAAEDDTS